MAKNGNAALQQFAAKRGNVPALKIGLGVQLTLIFLLALMLQVQTSEAFLLNSSAVGFLPIGQSSSSRSNWLREFFRSIWQKP